MKHQDINNQGILKLFDKIKNDKEFSEKLFSQNSLESMYKFCSDCIDGYDFNEFANSMQSLIKPYSNLRELSNDEISNVSGGNIYSDALYEALIAFYKKGGVQSLIKLLS